MTSSNLASVWNPWSWFRNDEASSFRSESNRRGRNLQSAFPSFGAFGPFSPLYREWDRMIENMFANMAVPAFPGLPSLQDMPYAFRPNVDIVPGEREYTVSVEAPGMDENDLKITISNDNMLIIRGEKQIENEDQSQKLRHYEHASFQRVIPLPADVDSENVDASCKNGILTVRLPRHEQEGRQRRIEIRAGEQAQENRQQRGERERQQGERSGISGSSAGSAGTGAKRAA